MEAGFLAMTAPMSAATSLVLATIVLVGWLLFERALGAVPRPFWTDHGRPAARHAVLMTASYGLCGILWCTAGSVRGRGHADVPLGMVLLLLLASTVLIFASGLVTATLGSLLLPPDPGRWRPWRAGLAGLLFSMLLFSGALEESSRFLKVSASPGPFGGSVAEDLLVLLTPLGLGVSASVLLSWLIPPWRRSILRGGGGGGDHPTSR